MTASVLQEKSQARSGGGTTQASTAFSGSCAVGSTIEAWITQQGNTAPTLVVDGAAQSYTQKASVYNAGQDTTLWLYIKENNGSATALVVTATWAGSQSNTGVWTREIGGVSAASYQTSVTNFQDPPGNTTDAITSGSITPTSAPALISAMTQAAFISVNSAAGTGMTAGTTGFGTWATSESKRVTSTSAIPATFTNSTDGGSGGLGFGTIAAVYSEAGGSSPVQGAPHTNQTFMTMARGGGGFR